MAAAKSVHPRVAGNESSFVAFPPDGLRRNRNARCHTSSLTGTHKCIINTRTQTHLYKSMHSQNSHTYSNTHRCMSKRTRIRAHICTRTCRRLRMPKHMHVHLQSQKYNTLRYTNARENAHQNIHKHARTPGLEINACDSTGVSRKTLKRRFLRRTVNLEIRF